MAAKSKKGGKIFLVQNEAVFFMVHIDLYKTLNVDLY